MVVAGSLAVVVAALVALLILWGAQQFVTFLSGLLPRINLGITHIDLGALVRTGLTAALRGVEAVLDAAAGPIVAVILAPAYVVNHLLDLCRAAVADLATTADWIVDTFVPRGLAAMHSLMSAVQINLQNLIAATAGQVRTYAAGLVADLHSLLSRVQVNLQDAIAAGDAAVVALMSRVQANLTRAITIGDQAVTDYARTLTVDTQSWVKREVAALGSLIGATADTAATNLGQAVASVERDIATAASTATADALGVISTDIGHVTQTVWADLDDAVTGVAGVAASDFPDIMGWVKSIPVTAVTDIAGVTALSTATAGALTRYLEECGMPNCRNLSKLGRELQELFALFEGGAFLALLAAMIADPQGMAKTLQSTLGPVVSGIADAARDLLDVA